MTTPQITVRPVTPQDRQSLANLIHFETQVHRHLDWRPPLEWIGYQPYLVAEARDAIIATLACPPDPPDIAWIRLFAISSGENAKKCWELLWGNACATLGTHVQVAAIPLQEWFRKLLHQSGFRLVNKVIMLAWERANLSVKRSLPEIRLRPMDINDLEGVEALDAIAFKPLWRNSLASLEMAFRQTAIATIVEIDGNLIGYQISTASHVGGHLARLAIHPESQGRGIGSLLLRDTLAQFERRGAQRVTVNTQHDNLASLALYERAGFQPTGEAYPVYQCLPEKET